MTELADGLVATDEDRLTQAEAAVRDYCGWHIAPPRTDTITVGGSASGKIMLPSLYVTAVTSVTVDGTLATVDEYLLHREGFISRIGWGWWLGDAITVVFTHGYDVPPPPVTAAVQALAQNLTDNPGRLSRKTTGPFTEVYGLPTDLLAGLGAYRIVPVS